VIEIDWPLVTENLIRIAIAFALALPVAWEGSKRDRAAGLRTFPIVAMAACGFALIVREMPDVTPEAQARILQGLVTGIGFVGGGAIVKGNNGVRGMVTAASIWNTGAIGASVAFAREEIAVVLSAINFLTLLCLTPLARKLDGENGDEQRNDN
jgi:putative Mg2+ transporter-C (MgtC) family protein